MSSNIQPAARLGHISEYYFSRKLKEIARLKESGRDIISLAIGGPDMMPPAAAIDAAVATLERADTHSYQMTVGLPGLRSAMAAWYERYYGVKGLNPDTQILPLIGSKECILSLSLAYLNPGDQVLVPNPGYPTYSSAPRLAGAEVVTYDLSPERGWMPDFDALEKMDLSKVKMMMVNYPHMPTGTPARREVFERLVDFGRRHGILVVNDNPYSFILNDKPLSILQVEGALDTAMELNSLSKALNMAGWRVGMLVGAAELVANVLKVKSNIDSGQPRAIMEGAIAALQEPPQWYAELNARYRERQKVAYEIMDALRCRCLAGQQGLFLWGEIPEGWSGGEAFSDAVLEATDVFVTPGFIFGSNGQRYIRISMCAPEAKLREALERIRSRFETGHKSQG